MIYLLGFVTLVLATARLTRVFHTDEIARPLRDWILRKWPPPSKPSKLVRCYWCSGFWVALLLCSWTHGSLIAMGVVGWQSLTLLPLAVLADAYAAARVLDQEPIEEPDGSVQ